MTVMIMRTVALSPVLSGGKKIQSCASGATGRRLKNFGVIAMAKGFARSVMSIDKKLEEAAEIAVEAYIQRRCRFIQGYKGQRENMIRYQEVPAFKNGFREGAKWAYENPKQKLVVCEDCKKVSNWDGLTSSCTCGCGKFKELEQ